MVRVSNAELAAVEALKNERKISRAQALRIYLAGRDC